MDNRLKLLSDDQTAPKEGEKYLPEILCEHQEKEGDECNICHPPAKVEAGDALSPLDFSKITYFVHEKSGAMVESKDPYRIDYISYQDFLVVKDAYQASMLREKNKDEDNERLRGLLERACIVLSSGIVGMPEEVRREARMVVREYIKAAVMGEQP